MIRRGIEEGRRTFANTLKYVLTTTSANLGNMISMAVASLFLPFLPLLAGQILLNNLLSDVPAVGIADDSVDRELVEKPRRWDMRFIGRFMIEFGLVSSVFDFLTFGVLLWSSQPARELFRTGWFVESLLTELVIALVVRTAPALLAQSTRELLLWCSLAVALAASRSRSCQAQGCSGSCRCQQACCWRSAAIVALYVAGAEVLKASFYSRHGA